MNLIPPSLRPAPVAGLSLRNPKVLLAGTHQPDLLRWLNGWPIGRRSGKAFLIRFVAVDAPLDSFPSDGFDVAIVPAPPRECAAEVIASLVRISRQGLLTRRDNAITGN